MAIPWPTRAGNVSRRAVTIVPSGPSDVMASGGGFRKSKTKSVSFRRLMRSTSVGAVTRDATVLISCCVGSAEVVVTATTIVMNKRTVNAYCLVREGSKEHVGNSKVDIPSKGQELQREGLIVTAGSEK